MKKISTSKQLLRRKRRHQKRNSRPSFDPIAYRKMAQRIDKVVGDHIISGYKSMMKRGGEDYAG